MRIELIGCAPDVGAGTIERHLKVVQAALPPVVPTLTAFQSATGLTLTAENTAFASVPVFRGSRGQDRRTVTR